MYTIMVESKSRVSVWVNYMMNNGDETHQKLAGNFEYLLQNQKDYVNGEFNIDNFPHFSKAENYVLYQSVVFGGLWNLATPEVYIVLSEENNSYIGTYGHQESVVERVKGEQNLYWEKHSISRNLEQYLDSGRTKPEPLPQLIENFEELENNPEIIQKPDELPNFTHSMKALIVYSVCFGTLWELSYPTLYTVLDINNSFHGIFGTEEQANIKANESENYQVQQVSIIDGDLPPEKIIM